MTQKDLIKIGISQFEKRIRMFDEMERDRTIKCGLTVLVITLYTLYIALAFSPPVLFILPFFYFIAYQVLAPRNGCKSGVFLDAVTYAFKCDEPEKVFIKKYDHLVDNAIKEMGDVAEFRQSVAKHFYRWALVLSTLYLWWPIYYLLKM